jgi:hypothetical protein
MIARVAELVIARAGHKPAPVAAPLGRAFVAFDVDVEQADDLAGLTDEELEDLRRELEADVAIAIGLAITARNRRARERGPMAA